jgi:hypothetical protein
MPDFSPMYSYGTAFAVVGTLAFLARDRDVLRATAIVLASWVSWCGAIMFTSGLTALGLVEHHHYPWYAGIGIDAYAAWALSRDPSNRIRATISAIFCVQIAMHMAFGLVKLLHGSADGDLYAQNLSITGWVELLLLGGWSIGRAGGRLHRLWRVVPTPRRTSHSSNLGSKE